MGDIVQRLRDPANNWNSGGRFEAADHIENLEARIRELEEILYVVSEWDAELVNYAKTRVRAALEESE